MLMQYEIDQAEKRQAEQSKEGYVTEVSHSGQEAVPERTDDQQRTLHVNLPLTPTPSVETGRYQLDFSETLCPGTRKFQLPNA